MVMEKTNSQLGLFPFEEILPSQLANRSVVEKDKSVKKTGVIWKIPLHKIEVRAGFNVRDFDPELIAEKKASLLEHGQISPGIVDVIGDLNDPDNARYILVEGYLRYCAKMDIVANMGLEEHAFFDAIVNGAKTTEVDRILQMAITGNSAKLKPHEMARCFGLLVIAGVSQVKIALSFNVSTGYVSQMIAFNKEPDTIKELVKSGLIAVDAIVKLQKEIPDTELRTAKILEAVNNGNGHGKLRGTDNKERQEVIDALERDNEGANDDQDNEGIINRNENYVTSSAPTIDTVENASGKVQKISLNKITGKLTKRESAEELAKKLIAKYDINIKPDIDDDDFLELFNLIYQYL